MDGGGYLIKDCCVMFYMSFCSIDYLLVEWVSNLTLLLYHSMDGWIGWPGVMYLISMGGLVASLYILISLTRWFGVLLCCVLFCYYEMR